jgi:hypothetical protein
LYTAKQAEHLLIPDPLPVYTLNDIENYVSSGQSKLLPNP